MATNDPIADTLTRIRNANTIKHDAVDVPASKMEVTIADIPVNEGYAEEYEFVENKGSQDIRITLKYGATKNDRILGGLKRIFKPGLRIYAGKGDAPKVLSGLGTAIISTNQGVIIDEEARRLGVDGEALALI